MAERYLQCRPFITLREPKPVDRGRKTAANLPERSRQVRTRERSRQLGESSSGPILSRDLREASNQQRGWGHGAKSRGEVLEAPTRAAARASGSQRIVWSARSPLCTPPPVTLSALSIQVSMAGQTLSPLRWQLAASSHFYGTVKGSRAYSVGQQRSPFQLHWNP